MTIVGVVPRTRNEAPGELNVESLHLVEEYVLASQDPQPENQLHVRTTLRDIGPIVAAVKREVESLDPDQPIGRITTMDEAIASSLATRRLMMVLLGAFAVLALVLASVGLYGVMALTVTQRIRELGIRMALGAERTNIFKLVLGQGMSLIAVGIGIGLIGASCCGPRVDVVALQRRRHRCRSCNYSRNFDGARRFDRLLCASAPRHASRSNHRAANRMKPYGERPPLRYTPTPQVTRIHFARCHHARARHRHEHRDLQFDHTIFFCAACRFRTGPRRSRFTAKRKSAI